MVVSAPFEMNSHYDTIPSLSQDGLACLRRADEEVQAWSYISEVALTEPPSEQIAPLMRGLRFGVKDVIDVADMPTRFGATEQHARVPYADAWCVAALRKAGAVPVGKTVTAEFAFRSPGSTRNPTNLAHTPGGSSSGSAAAVAAGMVRAALSTQTGGSIIRPAAYCGVLGFKPTFGILPRNGLFITCESLDVIGWHCADFDVMEAFADILLPLERAALRKEMSGLRYAVYDWNPHDQADAEAIEELHRVKHVLENLGASEVTSTLCKKTVDELMHDHDVIMHYEFARSLYPVISAKPDGISEHTINAVDKGLSISTNEYLRCRDHQTAQRRSWEALTNDADFMIGFSASGAAPEGVEFTGNSAFPKPWSVTGWPTAHIPTTTNKNGLPIGIQIIGPPNTDRTVIQWAARVSEAVSI